MPNEASTSHLVEVRGGWKVCNAEGWCGSRYPKSYEGALAQLRAIKRSEKRREDAQK